MTDPAPLTIGDVRRRAPLVWEALELAAGQWTGNTHDLRARLLRELDALIRGER